MAASISIGGHSSDAGLNLLSAVDLLLHERSLHSFFSTKTGIKSIDHKFQDLFSGAKVIGIGQRSEDEAYRLIPHLTVSSLLGIDTKLSSTPRVFIVAPPNTTIMSSIHTLLCDKLKSLPLAAEQSTESAAFNLLDSVQILQYLDLPGLAEALSEVSQQLFEDGQESTTIDDDRGRRFAGHCVPRKSVLLVQGLGAVLTTVQRRSGVVQTCAILSNLLRTIKHLSRIQSDLLVLVELEITTEGQAAREGDAEADHLDTSFSSATGVVMRVEPEGQVGSVIERGMDLLVCVHDGFAKPIGDFKGKSRDGSHRTRTRIVEVVKDTMGGQFGEWCVWV